jgi:hypothetical protein
MNQYHKFLNIRYLLLGVAFLCFNVNSFSQKMRLINSAITTGVCSGATVTFTPEFNNITPTSYQWYKNGSAISGATSSTYTANSTLNSDNFTLSVGSASGTYSATLFMTAAYNCVLSGNGQIIQNTSTSIESRHGQINHGVGVTDKGKILNVSVNVATDGLIVNLDFRNVNSRSTSDPTIWYDLTANHNDAKLHGNVSWSSDQNGGALNFGGTTWSSGTGGDYAQVKDGSNFTGFNSGFSGSFTIQSWIYPLANQNFNRIIDFGNGAGVNCILLTNNFDQSEKPGLHIEGTQFRCNQTLTNNQWHNVVATFSYPSTDAGHTTQGEAKIYIDGVDAGNDAGIYGAPYANSKIYMPRPALLDRTRCYIGRSNWWDAANHDVDFNGGMGAIQIYNRALTATEVLANYNNTKASYGR